MTNKVDGEKVWNWASQIMAGDGVASRSMVKSDPPLHILSEGGLMWCSGGAAETANTMTRRYCPECLTLAREMWADLSEEGEEL